MIDRVFSMIGLSSKLTTNWALVLVTIFCAVLSTSKIHALQNGSEEASAVGPVMKLFKSGRLPPERQGTVVEMICNRGNAADLRVIFDQAIAADGFAPELRINALNWLTIAAATRKVIPAGDLSPIVELIQSDNAAIQLAAIRLAGDWKLAPASAPLQKIVNSEGFSVDLKRAAIESLVAIGGAEIESTLIKLSSPEKPVQSRVQAVSGLVSVNLEVAGKQAAAVLKDARSADNLNAMLNAFFDRQDGSDVLARALKDVKLSQDVAKMALRYMYSVGRSDAALSAVLSEAAGVAIDPPPPTQEEVAKLAEEVVAKGDAARGEIVFRRAELSCLRCHAINRAGGQIGPDLSAVGGSSPIDYIINSIMNPNLAVKEQYVTKIFVLESGKVLTGVVTDRDDNRVVIRDAQGNSITIASADIEDEAEGKSMMPQGLTKFLTHEETLDLMKFVSELGKPGAYEIRKSPVVQRWRVMIEPPQELIEGVPHLEHIRQLILNSQPKQWKSAYALVSGTLPLDELRPDSSSSIVVLQADLQVNEAGAIGFKFKTDATKQVWIDDQPADAAEQVEVELAVGRHAITVRCEIPSEAGAGLQLELTRPDSSTAQFEVIGGP